VNVGSVAGGATGAITYTLDSNAPVSLPLSGGFAQFSLPTPNAGPHTLVIDYPQQSIFTASDPSDLLRFSLPVVIWKVPVFRLHTTAL
jgi:hypothetical protein